MTFQRWKASTPEMAMANPQPPPHASFHRRYNPETTPAPPRAKQIYPANHREDSPTYKREPQD